MKKKLFSILLSLAMVVTMMPMATMTAFAGDTNQVFIVDSSIVELPSLNLTSIEIFGDDDHRYMFAVNLGSLERGTTYSFTDMDKDGVARYEDYVYEWAIDATFKIDANDNIYATMVTESGTYQISTPITIADILPANFPTATILTISPEGAWKASSSNNTCYKYGDKIIFNDGSMPLALYTSERVIKGDNKYTAIHTGEDGTDTVEFTMLDNEVVSITFSTTDDFNKRLEGTYTAPVTDFAINNLAPESSASKNHGFVTVQESAEEKESVKISVHPNDGYELDTLTVKTEGGEAVTVTNNQFTMPAESVTVSATFKVKSNPTPAPTPDNTDKGVKTGDSSDIFFYGFTTLLALLGAGFVYGLRRKEEK